MPSIKLAHVRDCWQVAWKGHVKGWVFADPPLDPLDVVALEWSGVLATTEDDFYTALLKWLAHHPNAIWREK